MRRNKFLILVVLFWVFVSPAMAKEPFFASVKRIIDGDSLLVVSGKKTIEIRLYGVDCPEYNQPFSNEAKSLAEKEVYGQKVLVKPEYYDSYKRLVAIVEYENQILNSELVGAGLAWVYPQYCRKEVCKSWKNMEDSARKSQRGMWGGSPPIPPWEWKKMK